jgi:hypothetical protein
LTRSLSAEPQSSREREKQKKKHLNSARLFSGL